MRILVAVASAALAFATVSAGSAADTSASARETVEAVPQSRAEKLDALFETLKTAQNVASKAAEAAILKLWLESGSDTVDLLMEWTRKAMD